MIIVTVGMQLGFDRLIEAMDGLAPDLGMPVIAQTGKGTYEPQNMEARVKIAPAEFETLVSEAHLIVSHAGIGRMLTAARCGKPILLMPRRAELGEHRNDNQMATVRKLAGRPGILVAADEHELAPRICRGSSAHRLVGHAIGHGPPTARSARRVHREPVALNSDPHRPTPAAW